MFGDFNRVFQNEELYESDIPSSLQSVIDKNLPEGLTYKRIDGDFFIATSTTGENKLTVRLKVPDKIRELIKKGETISTADIAEYLYNSQKRTEVDSNEGNIYINDQPIRMDEYIKNPFDSIEVKGSKMFLFPPEMTEEFDVKLTGNENDKIVHFRRIPNDDVFIKRYESVDTCLIISADVDRRNITSMKFNIGVDVFNAEDIDDVLSTYSIIDALAKNELYVNGVKAPFSNNNSMEAPPSNIIDFWKKAKEVEAVLEAKFNLKAGVREIDAKNILALYRSLVEHKPYKEACEVLYLNGHEPDEAFLDSIKNAPGFYFEYTEGVELLLFGEKIQLYSLVGIFNAKLSEEGYSRDNNGYQFKIVSIEGRQMYRSFIYYLNENVLEESKTGSHVNMLESAEELGKIEMV